MRIYGEFLTTIEIDNGNPTIRRTKEGAILTLDYHSVELSLDEIIRLFGLTNKPEGEQA